MATISGEVRDENNDLLADCVVRAYRRDTGALLVEGVTGDGTTAQAGDTNFSDVSLLLFMDGDDNSTAFTDSSSNTKTLTAYGDAHIDTAQSVFGGSSAYFDGNGDYLSVTDSADFDMPADFTVEFQMRPESFSLAGGSANRSPLSFSSSASSSTAPVILLWSSGVIAWQSSGTDVYSSITLSLNTWVHIAFVRSGSTLTLYINGISRGSGTYSASVAPTALIIGRLTATTGDYQGYIDDVRISKVARYTADFTPPSAAFPLADVPAKPLGEYELTTYYTGEVNVVALDPDGGTTFNDLILRTTPV